MGCLGVHFALTKEEAAALLSATDDEEVLRIVQEEIEQRWDKKWLQETDKAWDAIHRCLTDGSLEVGLGTPLELCILGGRELYEGTDYIVCFLTVAEVKEVAEAIKGIKKPWMRERYSEMDDDYPCPSDDDFDYTWGWFQGVKKFFQKAAKAGRTVIFTASQ
jgi:hypothetical protein